MTPYFEDAWLTVYGGDCRAVLRELPAASVHCVVTSPPYWGLRDYGTPGQLGLEATPDAYVAALVDVFREVRRVLRDDGTVWLNLGDSYAHDSAQPDRSESSTLATWRNGGRRDASATSGAPAKQHGLKPKDLVGIPWRVAFALQSDGWYLRSDIIWSKPNPMPESVTDRPTKSHEYLFLLSKSARYFWDADAVREDALQPAGIARLTAQHKADAGGFTTNGHGPSTLGTNQGAAGRNLRSVWTIATAPYPGAHFATFPPKLVEPCVKAGTSERGVCPECGAPWVRVVERTIPSTWDERKAAGAQPGWDARDGLRNGARHQQPRRGSGVSSTLLGAGNETTGWRPSCDCVGASVWDGNSHSLRPPEPVPATVLDPFAGTGTTGLVAASLSRRAILIDLNPDYLAQCLARNRQTPLGLLA